MNHVILVGRLTRDPEIRYSQGETTLAIAKYTLAVDRKKKDEADFINCTALGKQGEFAEKYLKKGMKIMVTGRIQTGSYTNKDGVKVYTTDVMVDEHEFCERKTAEVDKGLSQINMPVETTDNGFMDIPAGFNEELPFN